MTEDLKSLISFQNLQDGYEDTPLREFIGDLKDYDVDKDTWNNLVCILTFDNLEVIESTTPYAFPEGYTKVKYSAKKTSKWGILAESIHKATGDDSLDVADIVGKRLHMKKIYHEFGKDKEGNIMSSDCWECVRVDGATVATSTAPAPKKKTASKSSASNVDARARVLELLNGKTIQQFNQLAFADTAIKADSGVMNELLSNTLVQSLIADGKVEVDGAGICTVLPTEED